LTENQGLLEGDGSQKIESSCREVEEAASGLAAELQDGAPDVRATDCPVWMNGYTLQWFALVVKPRFDKAVARALEFKGYETLLPLYRKFHRYGSRSREFELPLFPGYVCCRFDLCTKLSILTTPGVVRILGDGNAPAPLSDKEILSLQTAIRARVPVQPFPFLNAGQRVRINRGALAGLEGIVLGPKPRLRLVISITLLQRSVVLEIDRDDVSANGAMELAEVAG
jgi:transcription antitermination factor NusG